MATPSSTQHKPLPQCKAFLLCEGIAEDNVTGQLSLNKLIEVLRFPAFPAESVPFAVFVQLYDGIGRYQFAIELRDLSENTSTAATMSSSLDFPQRLVKMDIILPVDSLRLPHAGRYEFAVLLDGEELATQPIDAEFENGEEAA
jgi:hypothetical protein